MREGLHVVEGERRMQVLRRRRWHQGGVPRQRQVRRRRRRHQTRQVGVRQREAKGVPVSVTHRSVLVVLQSSTKYV